MLGLIVTSMGGGVTLDVRGKSAADACGCVATFVGVGAAKGAFIVAVEGGRGGVGFAAGAAGKPGFGAADAGFGAAGDMAVLVPTGPGVFPLATFGIAGGFGKAGGSLSGGGDMKGD